MPLIKPSALTIGSEAGGDDTVKRDGRGRPVLLSPCWLCEGTGRRGTRKCSGCKDGVREKSFRRVTSYIDVIEDKSALMSWAERQVLYGVSNAPALLSGVSDIDPESRDGKVELGRRAELAKEKAGSSKKSSQGTFLHGLSEMVDEEQALPEFLTESEFLDMKAYANGTTNFNIRDMERLVVNDYLGCAGTPDRTSSVFDSVIAPDGSIIDPSQVLITDLKTGRVDYGQLKMAMQLAIYSRSKFYVPGSAIREDLGNINQKWGVIMHLAAGSGQLDLYWADLEMGWAAVEVARSVHEFRRTGKGALVPFAA